jgi:uncharacterized membrane protein required for colicin V production
MSEIISLIVAVLFGVWGYKKRLFPAWAFAFNVIIAVYLAVMLTPNILKLAGGLLDTLGSYANVTVMIVLAVLYFVIAHFLSTIYLTGTYCISFHKVVDYGGGLILGFAGGLLIAHFILFSVAASPLKEISLVSKYLPAGMEQSSGKHIVNACRFVSSCSLQYGDTNIAKAIEIISGTAPANQPQTAVPKTKLPDSNQMTPSKKPIIKDKDAILKE